MTHPYFFGFGSLVNTATHTYGDTRPARLTGWRRRWVETTTRDALFLSAHPCPDTEIDGLIAAVPGADWAALDERETGYGRVDISAIVDHDLAPRPEVSLYSVPEPTHLSPQQGRPITLSYLDVVLQGYLRVFGDEGPDHFFATTDGWDRPVLDDRKAPRYPRHQVLTATERALVDELLDQHGITRI